MKLHEKLSEEQLIKRRQSLATYGVKQVTAIRLPQVFIDQIKKDFGGMQNFIEYALSQIYNTENNEAQNE